MRRGEKIFKFILVSAVFLGISLIPSTSLATSSLTENFDTYDESSWQKADGWSNGSMFNCTWRAQQVNFNDGKMVLSLDRDTDGSSPIYKGGEYRSSGLFDYGLYEVNMKPAKNSGIVSSFFTYTGPSDNNPWDEIDIEFLGYDTTLFQANYFVNGEGGHEKMIYLGFDASEAYHTYAFDWQPGYIAWFVDGVEKYRVTGGSLPTHKSKIMMNLWPGIGVDGWLGAYDGNPSNAYYNWCKFTSTVVTPTTSYNWAYEDGNSSGSWNYSPTWSGCGDSISVANSWGNLPTSTTNKYAGNSSVKFAFSHNSYYGYAGGGISTNPSGEGVEPCNDSDYLSGKDVSLFTKVQFYIMGDTTSKARIKFLDKWGNESGPVELTSYVSVNQNWQQVTIPMLDITLNSCDKTNLTQVRFLIDGCTYTQTGNWTFYIDNLQFAN